MKELKDYDGNPRRINKNEFENLIKFLKEYGGDIMIKVNNNGIVIEGTNLKKALLQCGLNPSDKIDRIEILVSNEDVYEQFDGSC